MRDAIARSRFASRASLGDDFSRVFFPHSRCVRAQESGVAASDVKKLQEAGVHTVEGLAHASRKFLQTIKGLSEQKVEKLKGIGACVVLCRSSARAWRASSVARRDAGSGAGFESEHRADARVTFD